MRNALLAGLAAGALAAGAASAQDEDLNACAETVFAGLLGDWTTDYQYLDYSGEMMSGSYTAAATASEPGVYVMTDLDNDRGGVMRFAEDGVSLTFQDAEGERGPFAVAVLECGLESGAGGQAFVLMSYDEPGTEGAEAPMDRDWSFEWQITAGEDRFWETVGVRPAGSDRHHWNIYSSVAARAAE